MMVLVGSLTVSSFNWGSSYLSLFWFDGNRRRFMCLDLMFGLLDCSIEEQKYFLLGQLRLRWGGWSSDSVIRLRCPLIELLGFMLRGSSKVWLLYHTGASSGKCLVLSWLAASVGVALLPHVTIFFLLGFRKDVAWLGSLGCGFCSARFPRCLGVISHWLLRPRLRLDFGGYSAIISPLGIWWRMSLRRLSLVFLRLLAIFFFSLCWRVSDLASRQSSLTVEIIDQFIDFWWLQALSRYLIPFRSITLGFDQCRVRGSNFVLLMFGLFLIRARVGYWKRVENELGVRPHLFVLNRVRVVFLRIEWFDQFLMLRYIVA